MMGEPKYLAEKMNRRIQVDYERVFHVQGYQIHRRLTVMPFELCLKCHHNKTWFDKRDDTCVYGKGEDPCGCRCKEWLMFNPEALELPRPAFKLDPRIDKTLDLFAKVFPEKVDGKEHPTRPTGKEVNGYGLRQLIHDEIARALSRPSS